MEAVLCCKVTCTLLILLQKQRVKNILYFLLVAHSAHPIYPKHSLISMICIKMQTVAVLHNDLHLHWFHTNMKYKQLSFSIYISYIFTPGMKWICVIVMDRKYFTILYYSAILLHWFYYTTGCCKNIIML